MFSPQAEEALTSLMQALTGQPELEEQVHERWRARAGSGGPAPQSSLAPDVAQATDELGAALLALAQPGEDIAPLARLFAEPAAPVLLLWLYANTWRRDIELARILGLASRQAELKDRVAAVASGRVLEGPLAD